MQPYRESKSFTIRIELNATFADDYEGDDDGGEWVQQWSEQVRPQLVASVLRTLAADPRFHVHPSSRGKAPEDELEVSVTYQPR